jgi:hypothetical protein
MDEARQVLRRLDRIEQLDREGRPAPVLLAEVRALLAEAEAWVRAAARGEPRAEAAVNALEEAVEHAVEAAPRPERTLVA